MDKKKSLKLFALLFSLVSCGFASSPPIGLDEHIIDRAIVLENSRCLDSLISLASQDKMVLLGEASHGTHEYYIWRDSISRRLIVEHGFDFIAVEGDFASLYELNRYVKGLPGALPTAREALLQIDRWPLWMWSNYEVLELAEWLREHNKTLAPQHRVGFYGMDVYDEWGSKSALLNFLRKHNRVLHSKVQDYYACFSPFAGDSWAYAMAVQQQNVDCSDEAMRVVSLLEESRGLLANVTEYEFFYALQNAIVKKNAEKFFRLSATHRDASAWNSRVHHMHQTVNRLLDHYGENSQGIVWAHNTHIGDARFTEMRQGRQQNIGELARVHWGPENVFAVGFTTYTGRVMAAGEWGDQMSEMHIAPARPNSLEKLLENTGIKSFYMLFDDIDRTHAEFMKPMGHRAVGVVFNPANEPFQYVNSIVPLRYDALIFFRQTEALNPLD